MRRIIPLILAAMSMPASAQPPETPTNAATPVASVDAFTLDTPIQTLEANPAAKAVIDKDLPGVSTHPMYESFKTMSLRQLQPLANGKISDDRLALVAKDLAALPAK